MELFNEYKNIYFQCIQNIINDIYYGVEYTENEIRNYIKNNTFNEVEYSLLDKILNKNQNSKNNNIDNLSGIKLFKYNGAHYSLLVNSPIPIRFSKIEIIWLKMLLEDANARANLDESIVNKLENKLKLFDLPNYTNYWIKKNIHKNGDDINDKDFNKYLKTLLKAIQLNKQIKYISIDNSGEVHYGICFPYRIEYSMKNNKYWAIVLPKDTNEAKKINVSGFKKIEIINEVDNNTINNINTFFKGKKNLISPLILEIENKFNTVERCFLLFSNYDKKAYFDKNKNKHILQVYYYSFDEAEIIKDILSLGSAVIVLEPLSIRNKIIERINKKIDS